MNIFKRLYIALTYGPELEAMLAQIRKEAEDKEAKRTEEFVSLCARHQPKYPGYESDITDCAVCRDIYLSDEV